MAAARCYECSTCGGLVREAARQCSYCGSPVATIRCNRCFTMNIPEALHCLGCGAELGLMPAPHSVSARSGCPRCRKIHLDAFQSIDGTFYDCSQCGGQFLPHAVLREIVKRHEGAETYPSLHFRRSNPLSERVTYLPCPDCNELMLRRNFGRVSGIIVDVCSKHGTWFDVGELARILAFVARGGLERERAVREDEQRRLHQRASLLPAAPIAPMAESTDASQWEDVYAAVQGFVEWVHHKLH